MFILSGLFLEILIFSSAMIGEKSEKQKLSRIEMMECAFLDPIDYDKRVILGKCPKTPLVLQIFS